MDTTDTAPAPQPPKISPKISVIMAAYNAGAFIRGAIASLQAQTLDDWELLVVDDASSDDTADVVARMAAQDKRIMLLKQATNGGPSVARNAALAVAQGDWVTVLDADDRYLPERLQMLLAHAEQEHLHMVADNQLLLDAGADRLVRSGIRRRGAPVHWTVETTFMRSLPGDGFAFGLLKPLMRRDFLVSSGLSYREDFRFAEDLILHTELLLKGARAEVLPTPGYVYTMPVGSQSGQAAATSRTVMTTDELLRGGTYLLGTYDAQLTRPERKAIQLRQRRLIQRENARGLRVAIKQKRVFKVLRLLCANPLSVLPLWRGVKIKLIRYFNIDGMGLSTAEQQRWRSA